MSLAGRLFLFIAILVLSVYGKSPIGFKSAQKCKEYAKLRNEPPPIIVSSRIFFPGQAPARERYPYLVRIFELLSKPTATKMTCVGALISERIVLAAAHCITSRITFVKLGTTDTINDDRHLIERTIKHRQYSNLNYYNDIALVELQNNVQFSSNVQPACLQLTKTITGEEWLMDIFERKLKDIDHFFTVGAKEVESDGCQQNFRIEIIPYGVIDYLQICVLENRTEKPLQGEGYSVLVRRDIDTQQMVVIGIPSIGIYTIGSNSESVFPTLSTRVSSYIEFIESNAWPQDPKLGCSNVTFQL